MEFLKIFKTKQEKLACFEKAEIMAAEYKKAKEELESANRVKSDFLANISHELRTPLNAILGYSEMLLDEANQQKIEICSDKLNKIVNSAKHLSQLINDILDITQLEAGNIAIYKKKYCLRTLVNEVEAYVKPLLPKDENVFSLQLGAMPAVIHTDIFRLRQALINLLDNAVKFTKKGKIVLDVASQEGCIKFAVIDTGVGIPEQYRESLFQCFSQVDSSLTRKYNGSGKGLYLTKCICDLLGGTLTVESKEGKGSAFTLLLPQ